jgi:hypothetical protein
VRKSFLETLELNENSEASLLITEEFFEGIQNYSKERTTEELNILSKIDQKMNSYNTLDGKPSFINAASQTCQDVLLYVGKWPNLVCLGSPYVLT